MINENNYLVRIRLLSEPGLFFKINFSRGGAMLKRKVRFLPFNCDTNFLIRNDNFTDICIVSVQTIAILSGPEYLLNRLTVNVSYMIKQKSGQFCQCIIYDKME